MSALPPGPSSTILSTYKVGSDPFEFYRRCAEDYGDPFTLHALNGTVVCTGDPEGAREIFQASADHFMPFGAEVAESIIKHSLFLLGGEAHKRERKLLVPPFHGARMKLYAGAMERAALGAMEGWTPGQELGLLDTFQHISMEVILRAVFGVEDPEEIHNLHSEIRHFVDNLSPSFLFFRVLQRDFGGIGPWARFKRAEARLNVLLYGLIADRRESGQRGDDILSMMLDAKYDDGTEMHDDQVRDELMTLLIAGHETTAVMMTWVMDHLYRSGESLVRLLEELHGVGAVETPEVWAEQPYLTAVCKEALRLHPVLSDHLRLLIKPLELRGHTLPEGVAVAVIPSLVHANPTLYPEPGAFRPERFLDASFSPYEYVPFGGAPRRCIGSAFAQFEMNIVLATLLTRARFELLDHSPLGTTRRNLVMAPDREVRVRYLGPR